MKRYKNLAGNSGVLAFEIKAEGINVQFKDRKIYVYTYESAGKANIEKMKALALSGKGLSTFISQKVKGKYELVIE